MPWLSRRNSATDGATPEGEAKAQKAQQGVQTTVQFIPAQIDGLCGTAPAHHKLPPSQLMAREMAIMMQEVYQVIASMMTTSSFKLLRGLFGSRYHAIDTILQTALFTIQAMLVIYSLPMILLLPGLLSVPIIGAACLLSMALAWPMRGPRIVLTTTNPAPMTEDFSDEKWIYVNGMMCSNYSLESQCARITKIFNRPVTGVHNQTCGFVADLLTCAASRWLSLPTSCTLALSSQLRDACLANSTRKVIVIAHGIGAVHLSIALDQLHATLPVDVLSKLEVYTFGSAASHLNNPALRMENLPDSQTRRRSLYYTRPDGSIASPVKATLASLGYRIEDHERVIPHIEHYALTTDVLARYGVLHNIRNVLDNRFCGRVFVFDDKNKTGSQASGTGFSMNEDYLSFLFPSNISNMRTVLDISVDVDLATAEKREFTAEGVVQPQKSIATDCASPLSPSIDEVVQTPDVSPRNSSKDTMVNGFPNKRRSWGMSPQNGMTGVQKARACAQESDGRTVRQLSRLWRYAHGGKPVGEGVALVNGVGHNGDHKMMNGNGHGLGLMQ